MGNKKLKRGRKLRLLDGHRLRLVLIQTKKEAQLRVRRVDKNGQTAQNCCSTRKMKIGNGKIKKNDKRNENKK